MNNKWVDRERRRVVYLSSSLSQQHGHPVPQQIIPQIRQYTPEKYKEWYSKGNLLPAIKSTSKLDEIDLERLCRKIEEEKEIMEKEKSVFRQWEQDKFAAIKKKAETIDQIERAEEQQKNGLKAILSEIIRRVTIIEGQLAKGKRNIRDREQKIRELQQEADRELRQSLQIALLELQQAEKNQESWKRRLCQARMRGIIQELREIVLEKQRIRQLCQKKVGQIRNKLQSISS